MALDKDRLKNKIKSAFIDAKENGGDTADDQLEFLCGKLAEAIVDEVKQVKITYTAGLTAGSTAVTGAFNHTTS